VTPPVSDDERCSAVSARLGEPLAGTAPLARAWLVLEQPGPYGRDALTDSHLPAEIGAALAAACEGTRTTVLLARTVGRHADDGAGGPRRFWFAHTAPGGVRMRSGTIDDAVLVRPDLPTVLADAAHGQLPPWGVRDDDPLLLVCTNARRDRCCAVEGLPLAEAVSAVGARVLEVNHLGGHRFAPTALLLPWGYAFGRLTPDAALGIVSAAASGRLGRTDLLRGRTSAALPAQAAAIAVRLREGLDGIDDIDVLRRVGEHAVPIALSFAPADGHAELEVRHRDGRAWQVVLEMTSPVPDRSESCGKPAVPVRSWLPVSIEPAPTWL